MVAILIGFAASVVAGFIPGMSPISASLLCQLLHLTGNPETAITASIAAYLIGMVTCSSKQAYVPKLEGSLESIDAMESCPTVVENRSALQANIAWKKIAVMAILPMAILWLNTTPAGEFVRMIPATNVGYLFLVPVVLRGGFQGALYIGVYIGGIYLLRDNLYMPFIVGLACRILPVLVGNDLDEPTNEDDLAGNLSNEDSSILTNIISIPLTFIYTISTSGLSASILTRHISGNGVSTYVNLILQNVVMEIIIFTMFIGNVFTGKAGVGQIARPEYVSIELLAACVLLSIAWQIFFADMTNSFWESISKSKNIMDAGRFIMLVVVGCSFAYVASNILAVGVAVVMFFAPQLLQLALRKSRVAVDEIVYSIPMIFN